MRSMLNKRLMAGVLSAALFFCQMSFPAMADTKETLGATEEVISKVLYEDTDQLEQEVKKPVNTSEMSDELSKYAVEDTLTLYIWVIDENGNSLSGGHIPGSRAGYQPGVVISGVGPTHNLPNKNGVATLKPSINGNNRYQYFAFGDENAVYDNRQQPNLLIEEQECLLKVELALKDKGFNKFTLIKPGTAGYPADPLNPEATESQTKTFHGSVGDGKTGIEGATIIAKNPVSGDTITETTDETGNYSIELDDLRFGTTWLTAEKDGNELLTSDGKKMYGIDFLGGDTKKSYDFGMPPANREYVITVTGGSASLSKASEGATVTISAGTPPSGKQFTRWVSPDGVSFADAKATTTSFRMPPKTVTINAEFEAVSNGISDIKTYHGTTETDTFTYGDTITVKVVPNTAGSLPAEPMALYNDHGDQISDPVNAAGSAYTMTVNTAGKTLSIGSNSIMAKYVNRGNAEGTVTVNLNRKVITSAAVNESHSSASKVYDGSNRFSGVQLINLGGLVSGDAVEAAADGTSGSADAGRHPFTATTVSALSGSSAGYYTLAPAVVGGTVTINNPDITKVTPTGKPGYTRLTAQGKTLADAALNLGTISAPGTVAWELPDTTVAAANTEYKWVFTPADGANYNSITGYILLYTGSGSSSNNNSGGGGGGGGGGSSSSGRTSNTQPETSETLGSWQQDQSGWKFIQPSGEAHRDTWVYVDSRWYRVGSDGYLSQGWNAVDGSWYYLEANSGEMKTGWLSHNGSWYHLEGTGAMETGWAKVDGSWYYLEGSGAMKTGWENVDGSWYHLQGTGAMETGWVNVDGSWYYLEGTGAMETGWVNVDGSWYYLEGTGAMKTGWVETDGKWYYLYDDGRMAADVTTPDGYYVDASGIWR